jgi:5-formyltetrahydrofolate cyclo-ligase
VDRVKHDPSKNQLRKHLRDLRRALTKQQQNAAAARLVTRLVTSPFFRSSRRIACYLPNDGEIDPTPLIERLWKMQRQCFLPVLSRLSRDRLWFAQVLPETRLSPNRFGIPEPVVPARCLLRAQELDLILMPLVGFDLQGNRLGMGGGFYDRSLEFLRHRSTWHKPRLVGLAHECQRVEALAPEPWDIPLQGVVTDRAIYLAD